MAIEISLTSVIESTVSDAALGHCSLLDDGVNNLSSASSHLLTTCAIDAFVTESLVTDQHLPACPLLPLPCPPAVPHIRHSVTNLSSQGDVVLLHRLPNALLGVDTAPSRTLLP